MESFSEMNYSGKGDHQILPNGVVLSDWHTWYLVRIGKLGLKFLADFNNHGELCKREGTGESEQNIKKLRADNRQYSTNPAITWTRVISRF